MKAELLSEIRNLSIVELKNLFQASIPAHLAPSAAFCRSYMDSEEKLATGLHACLTTWVSSGEKIIPVEFQLRATIAVMSGQDALIDVGTGYGKTLCMIIPCLLDAPGNISIIISPLKRLQAVQVLELERYGIRTVAINEDTPNDPLLWKDIRDGKFSALVVQPEQLSRMAGHLPRLARLLGHPDRRFRKRIVRVHVDEAHSIHTVGCDRYSQPAFRPAWGKLGEFRVRLGKGVVFQALSGTQPKHIKKTIIEHLLFDEEKICHIKLSSNRPNTVYATHPIVGDLSDFRNLDFLVPDHYPLDTKLPKTLVFHDNTEECAAAAVYLNGRIPKTFRSKDIVKHYHGGMSQKYLTETYEEFSKLDSTCRILHATEGASTGLDIPDIEAVIQYGIPRDVPNALQRGGRGGRSKNAQSIFLIMYELWVMDTDLSVVDFPTSDPDHPTVAKLDKTSKKPERTSVGIIKIIQCKDCLRDGYAQYLGDETPEALQYTTPTCCSRHPGSDFHIRHFFKGRLLYQDAQTGNLFYGAEDEADRIEILPPQKEKRKARDKRRPPDERKSLASRLKAWRYQERINSPLAALPLSSILDDMSINTLAKLHPENVTSYQQITVLLDQTKEWEQARSKKIFDIIQQFDQDFMALRQTAATQKKSNQKRAKLAQDRFSFEEATKENEERIRQEVLKRFQVTQQLSGNTSRNTLQTSTVHNVR